MEDSDNAPFHKMDPVLSLVMEQARKDIDFTCSALSISNGEFEFDNPFSLLSLVTFGASLVRSIGAARLTNYSESMGASIYDVH